MTLHHASLFRMKRRLTPVLLALLCGSAVAAESDDDGPDVTIIAGADRTIYEYWQNGHLRRVMIVPAMGKPYYLRPADHTRGHGELDQAGMLIPSWVIVEF